nr:MAG TPA: hypothetical protein [Caudoviricetes sp.]
MTYQLKVIYPKQESVEPNKFTERSHNEFFEEVSAEDAIKTYKMLLLNGYSISTSFTPPEIVEDENFDAFIVAENLELAGLPYTATIKLKSKTDYERAQEIAKIVASQGFDYDITAKLKINENSPVDFDKESTWFDSEYAKYSVLPKAKSYDIMDLKSLYDTLLEMNLEVSIGLKMRTKKDNDEVFEQQLDSYPDDTLIILKLKDADIYEE